MEVRRAVWKYGEPYGSTECRIGVKREATNLVNGFTHILFFTHYSVLLYGTPYLLLLIFLKKNI
jgi:hypothetical protein